MASLIILQALFKLHCVVLRRHSHLHRQRVGFGSGLSRKVTGQNVVLWLVMLYMTQLKVRFQNDNENNYSLSLEDILVSIIEY